MSSRAKKKLKRDREDQNNPVVQPEVKPKTESCTALSVAKGLVTGPLLWPARATTKISLAAPRHTLAGLVGWEFLRGVGGDKRSTA